MLFLVQDMHLVKGIFTGCAGMGFYSGRVEQIADFSQCRLLLERMDLCQNCQMLCYRKYRTENPTTNLKTAQNRRNRRLQSVENANLNNQ
jgi:hypothetical protein